MSLAGNPNPSLYEWLYPWQYPWDPWFDNWGYGPGGYGGPPYIPGSGGGPEPPAPVPPPAAEVMPEPWTLPPEETTGTVPPTEELPPWWVDWSPQMGTGGELPPWLLPVGIGAGAIGTAIGAGGGLSPGAPGAPGTTGETWNPPSGEPEEPPYIPEGGIPTFPIDVTANPATPGAGAVWNPFLPEEPPYIPEGGIPTFPIDVTANPANPRTGETWNPFPPTEPMPPTGVTWNPIPPETPGPILWPWVFPPEAGGGGAGAGGSVVTPPIQLPNFGGQVSGSGAPGPGQMAPVVGDPIPKQSVFHGTPQQGPMPNFSEILAQILQGGQYAAR